MRTITVTSPQGVTWSVRVVWQPRWRALARRFGGWRRGRRDGTVVDPVTGMADIAGSGGSGGRSSGGGGFGGLGDELAVLALLVVALVVLGALFWWFLLPLLLVVVDALVVGILLGVTVLTRVLLRRPWTVEVSRTATGGGDSTYTTNVVGWRAALRARDEIATKLRAGERLGTLPVGDAG